MQSRIYTTERHTSIKARPLVRCAKGAKLIKAYVRSYNIKATNDNWQMLMGKGFMPYARHAAKCEQCMNYEKSKRSKS